MDNTYRKTSRMLLLGMGLTFVPSFGNLCAEGEREITMGATAYAQHGLTATGERTRRGVAAADPRVLPLGSKIEVTQAGVYSGLYDVLDTGRLIKGRKIDLFMPSRAEAKRFGRRPVRVRVLKRARPRAD